jgi:hypothetical protein
MSGSIWRAQGRPGRALEFGASLVVQGGLYLPPTHDGASVSFHAALVLGGGIVPENAVRRLRWLELRLPDPHRETLPGFVVHDGPRAGVLRPAPGR